MIRAVLFDYGGVLTEGGRQGSIARTAAELFGIDVGWEKLDALHDKLRRGTISTEDFFLQLSAIHQSPKAITEAEWNAASKDVFVRSEPVYAVASSLRKEGIRTGILSNVYAVTASLLHQIGNYDGFDPLILSCEVHSVKPEPEIFRYALDVLNLSGTEVAFVDDQIKSLPVAESLGIHTILAENPDQIVSDLKSLLQVENNLTLLS